MAGSGSRGTFAFHLLRLGIRLMVFLLLVGIGSWVYLLKRTESAKYAADLQDSIQASLGGLETQISGFSQKKGRMEVGRLIGEGGSQTFYNSLEVRNIRCRMGVLDGLFGKWDPGPIAISSLIMELRPGADDADSARALAEALFRENEKVTVNSVEIASTTLFWGYTERTRGSIENSSLVINRIGSGWRMTFSGGTFSQNWLRNLEIVNLVALVDPDGVTFEKAEFRRGRGEVDLSGLRLDGGERPTVSGTVKIRNLGLEHVLSPVLESFLEGTISGDFEVSGSTNSAEGIAFDGVINLDGPDSIVIRERLHLLEALSVVDYVRNYHRLEFQDGSFRIRTGNGTIRISDLKLKSQDIFTLEGGLLARAPTAEEKKEDLAKAQAAGVESPFSTGNESGLTAADLIAGSDFGLSEANNVSYLGLGRESKKAASSLIARLAEAAEMRQLQRQDAERASKSLRYEGSFLVTLLPDSFELAPKLIEQFPVDPKTNRIPIEVPIRGTIFQLTEQQAREIYQQRTR